MGCDIYKKMVPELVYTLPLQSTQVHALTLLTTLQQVAVMVAIWI